MLYLKACPRCRGDMKFDRDLHGKFLECLQCGLFIDSRRDQPRMAPQEAAEKAA